MFPTHVHDQVLECSWARLLAKLEEAQDLDEVIAAHDLFIDGLLSQCLLDVGSQTLLTQVRTIYDLIIQFQTKQADILEIGMREKDRRSLVEVAREERTNLVSEGAGGEGDWVWMERVWMVCREYKVGVWHDSRLSLDIFVGVFLQCSPHPKIAVLYIIF